MTGPTVIAFSSGVNNLILGLAAGVLVVFALVVSMVIPRTRPDFPGRSMGVFLAVAVLLVAGMLTAVEALGEGHHFKGGGTSAANPGTAPTTPADTTPESTGTTGTTPAGSSSQSTTQQSSSGTGGGGSASGDPTAGKAVFTSSGCSGCHTLQEAGANGSVGPNLDQGLKGKTPSYIRESIVSPNAEITQGYQPGIMPQDYEKRLSAKQLTDLVAFLDKSANG